MANVTIIRPQSHKEWLEIRKSGIGSSEVATIVGLNPYETPYQLWRRKVGIDEPKQENAAMRYGHHLEDAVSRMWHDSTGREIIKRSAIDWIIRDNERPYLQVSPDRTYWLGDSRSPEEKGILEIKTTRMKVDPTDLPKYWFCQIQYQLGVAGYKEGSLAWLSAGQGFDFGYVDLKFIPDFYEFLIDAVSKFWTDNILGKQEPDSVSTADVVMKFDRHIDKKTIECNEEVFEAYSKLKDVKKEITALTERKEILEGTLKMAFGDAEALSYGGDTIATWKAPKPSMKFDQKKFLAENKDLALPYMHQVQGSRTLLLK